MNLELHAEQCGGLSDAERLIKCFDDLKNADCGATVVHKTNDQNQLDMFFICTREMAEKYRRFPEVLFLDGTYK